MGVYNRKLRERPLPVGRRAQQRLTRQSGFHREAAQAILNDDSQQPAALEDARAGSFWLGRACGDLVWTALTLVPTQWLARRACVAGRVNAC